MEETHSILTELAQLVQNQESVLESTGFQSMLAAAIEVLNRVLHAEEHAAVAAISLAQQERLQLLIQEIQQALALLMGALRESGKQLLALAPPSNLSEQATSWWYALSEAIAQLEKDMQWLHSLTQSQERGSPTWTLGTIVEEMLQHHLAQLSEEAERWNP